MCRVTFCCAGLELPPEPDLHQVGVVGVGPVAAAARELRQEGDTLAASQQCRRDQLYLCLAHQADLVRARAGMQTADCRLICRTRRPPLPLQ